MTNVEKYSRFIAEQRKKSEYSTLNELTFGGSPCTKDCSGHQAGFRWAKRNGVYDVNTASPSFNNGAAIAAKHDTEPEIGGETLGSLGKRAVRGLKKVGKRSAQLLQRATALLGRRLRK